MTIMFEPSRAGFKPLHAGAASQSAFQIDRRFAAKDPLEPLPPRDDPLSDAWNDGFRAATAQVREDMARVADANAKVEQAYARLAEAEGEAFAEKLRETVVALCGAVLEHAAIDPAMLSDRVSKALALLRRSTDARVLRLHPDDLAMVGDRLPPDLETRADPLLARGSLRIETARGGVEDGPAQWQEAIRAAVRAC